MKKNLYRGIRKDNGEWAFGFPFVGETSSYILYAKMSSGSGSMFFEFDGVEVFPETVGQYTGLKDKNGKRIFEGDILKWDSMEWGCDHLEIASWDYELFNMRRNDWEEWCEVIGNIHDNPELLLESKEECNT